MLKTFEKYTCNLTTQLKSELLFKSLSTNIPFKVLELLPKAADKISIKKINGEEETSISKPTSTSTSTTKKDNELKNWDDIVGPPPYGITYKSSNNK